MKFFQGGRCNATLGGVCYIHLTTGAEYNIVYRNYGKNAREKPQTERQSRKAGPKLYNIANVVRSGQKNLINLEISSESNIFFF